MKKKRFTPAVLAACAMILSACSSKTAVAPSDIVSLQSGAETQNSGGEAADFDGPEQDLEEITVLLDWTPNTNHTGLYVAQKLGYFQEKGFRVEIVQPPEDGASALVASGKAQFGVGFQDTLAPAFASDAPLPVTAVAALIQHNTSGILSLSGKGIDRPAGMENRTYATWDNPVEKAIVQYVVEKDGGDSSKIQMVPSTVTDVITAIQTNVDSVWVYYAWDGVAAKVKGVETDYFAFQDIEPLFDYYTPVLIANNEYLKNRPESAKKFLEAVKKGYLYAMDHPEEAAEILLEEAPELDRELVTESQKWLAGQYQADSDRWGYMAPERWDGFYRWLSEQKLVDKELPPGTGYTNEYLPQ